MKNFSQNSEQDAILNYFGDFKGTFLSIGENDGETLSNVRALALSGWCGVMVEPSPKAFPRLKKLYDNDKKGCFYLYNFAVGTKNGKEILHDSGELLKTGDVALVSTFVPAEMDRFKSVLRYDDVEVKVFKWKTLFNRFTLKKFDFINIDAEAMDVEILVQIDLTDTKLLTIEWNSKDNVRKEILEYTSKFGMDKVIYTSAENIIICRK